QDAFSQALRQAGLGDIAYRNLSFGIAAIHTARKPG
ncbi:bifunctional demethylmenaquinone methyltransferase/2-methoxy-6-polyprenyl-1,4-benzoquinol methylase, partial [Citrobacter sp. AAK_AS5]